MNVNPTKAAAIDVNNKFASVFLETSGGRSLFSFILGL